MRKVSAVFAVAVAMSLSLAAQQRTTIVHMNNPQTKVQQLPYTAEFKTTRVQTLANGATISHETIETRARDAAGRTLTSTTRESSGNDGGLRVTVNIFDPEARTSTMWMVPGKTVTVTKMMEPGVRPNCATTIEPRTPGVPTTRTPVVRDKPKAEDLGTEEIAGVEAKGFRTTSVIPAGQIGNDEPLMRTHEQWTAVNPGLRGLVVRTVMDDPQQGKTTKELTAFTQGDPDAALFQPPSDYEIVTREPSTGCSSGTTTMPAPVATQE